MNVLNKLKKTSASALALLAVIFFGVSAVVYALTDAGEVITNIASVDYEDENGNSYTATSNEAEVTVGTVYGSTIEQDRLDIVAAPGQTVYIPYVLTNTGNNTDTYTVGLANEDGTDNTTAEGAVSGGANDEGTGLVIYEDTNGNGQPDAGEPTVTSVDVAAGDIVNLVAAVTVPSSLSANDVIGVVLTADSDNTAELTDDLTSGNGQDTLEGTVQGLITVSTGAVLVPTKSSSINSAGTAITYTLTVKNNGGDAQDVDIFDAIPAGTTFQAGSLSVSGLLDRAGNETDDLQYLDANLTGGVPDVANVTVTAASLGENDDAVDGSNIELTNDFGEPAGVDLDGDGIFGEAAGDNNDGVSAGAGADGISDVLGFLLRDVSLENGVTVSVSYTVDINSGLAAGTQIKNTFCVAENLAGIDEDGGSGPEPSTGVGALAAGTAINDATCSNTTIDVVPQIYDVDADDTDGNGTPDTTTVGDDEDARDDDNQYENSASVGETIDLRNVITNNGNGPDNFDLAIATDVTNTFPAGTLFTFWDATGSVPLTDDSGNGIPDTGTIAAGSSVTITVKAQLPSTIVAGDTTIGGGPDIVFANNQYFIDVASGGNSAGTWDGGDGDDGIYGDDGGGTSDDDDERFSAVLTATSVGSVNDPNASVESDTKVESLGVIVAAGVDLANGIFTTGGDVQSATSGNIDLYAEAGDVTGTISGVDVNESTADATDPDDTIANLNSSVQNVHGKDDPAVANGSALGAEDASDFSTSYTVGVGQTFRVDLLVSNEAGSPDAFTLGFRSFSASTGGSTQALTGFDSGAPTGWNVVFRDRTSDAIISSTPSIPGGSVYSYYADITVSSDGAQALDGTEYFFAFSVNSSANADSDPYDTTSDGVSDVKVDRVQISPFCAISIIPNGSEQVQPGGTEDFAHTLSNDGNSDKSFDLSTYVGANDGGTDDDSWTSTLFVDTDADDLPDTALSLALSGGSNVCYYDEDSNRQCDTSRIAAVVTAGDANITLQPGEQILLWNRVFAPATATNGFIQTSTVVAAGTGSAVTDCAPSTITATDTATVILGQIRLEKTVAVDETCECDGENSAGADLSFVEISATPVEPGECVVWRLIAENEGDVDADNVVINDAITQFSVIASAGVYGAANPSSAAIVAPSEASVIQLCESENNGGTPLDCTDDVNLIDKGIGGSAAADEVDFDSSTGSLTFRAGFGADNSTGGTLVPGDRAIAQFCVQVE